MVFQAVGVFRLGRARLPTENQLSTRAATAILITVSDSYVVITSLRIRCSSVYGGADRRRRHGYMPADTEGIVFLFLPSEAPIRACYEAA